MMLRIADVKRNSHLWVNEAEIAEVEEHPDVLTIHFVDPSAEPFDLRGEDRAEVLEQLDALRPRRPVYHLARPAEAPATVPFESRQLGVRITQDGKWEVGTFAPETWSRAAVWDSANEAFGTLRARARWMGIAVESNETDLDGDEAPLQDRVQMLAGEGLSAAFYAPADARHIPTVEDGHDACHGDDRTAERIVPEVKAEAVKAPFLRPRRAGLYGFVILAVACLAAVGCHGTGSTLSLSWQPTPAPLHVSPCMPDVQRAPVDVQRDVQPTPPTLQLEPATPDPKRTWLPVRPMPPMQRFAAEEGTTTVTLTAGREEVVR